MDTVTRRRFLLASGVVSCAAIAGGAATYSLRDIFATGPKPGSAPPVGPPKRLVLITLYGGNDGLNTVIPYTDSAYYDARPQLAYRPEEVLRLDNQLGLNPGLTNFKRLFDARRLAIVRGLGYPKPDRSHFRSMDIWQTAQPDRPVTTGWLGRWLDATGGDPRHAVSFESVLPPLLAGTTTAGAAVPLDRLNLPAEPRSSMLAAYGKTAADDSAMRALCARSYGDLVGVEKMIKNVSDRPGVDPSGSSSPSAGTPTGGRGSLALQLDLVARCVEANVATRVFSVSSGGFDTHADEKGSQQRLLTALDLGVAEFVDRMARTEAGRKVVVGIYSEFGRRVRANASDGTDHGTAGDFFLLGEPVHGGLYGDEPSLTDLDAGDLKFTTDFRDVYATLLHKVLDIEPGRILDGWKGNLDQLLR